MVEKETTIGPQEGLHTRPAAQFVTTAKGFSSEIMIVRGDKEANAKSSMKIMTLGAKKGDDNSHQGRGERCRRGREGPGGVDQPGRALAKRGTLWMRKSKGE
jgi:phosphocarrier protein HPr